MGGRIKRRLEPAAEVFRGIAGEPRRLLHQGIAPHEPIPLKTRVVLGAWLTVRGIWESDLTLRAGATAYTFIFSIVPLLTTTLAFFTAFPALQGSRESLQHTLFDYLLPAAARDVQAYLNQFAERAAAAGAVSSVVFFVTILLLLQNIEGTFNSIWKAERARTWGERLQVLALFLIAGALGATLIVTVSREAAQLTERIQQFDLGGLQPWLMQVGLRAAELMTAWAVFAIANKVLPSTHVRWSAAITGGIIAGTLWQALKNGFTWYIVNLASYQNIYGAVGTVPVFFLWLYLTILLLLVGAYIAFVQQNFRALVNTRRVADQGRQQIAYHAVAVTAILARAFHDREQPLTADTISLRAGFDTYFVIQALKQLTKGGLVLCTGNRGIDPLYILAVPSESVTVGEVVRLATGEDLEVPDIDTPSLMHRFIAEVFEKARGEEGNVLERVPISALEGQLTGPPATPASSSPAEPSAAPAPGIEGPTSSPGSDTSPSGSPATTDLTLRHPSAFSRSPNAKE